MVAAFNHALETVFIVAVPFAIVAFVLCWFLKETPLRNTAFVATAPRHGHEELDGAVTNGASAVPLDDAAREVHELPAL
jgi:hypothetical protein